MGINDSVEYVVISPSGRILLSYGENLDRAKSYMENTAIAGLVLAKKHTTYKRVEYENHEET